ncbi:MAG: acetyl-CoA C-acetyltransferase [Planctomycetes bacterium]|nr:acetyl-CoA C-acetyltransferase [Planctomycetota bacterium]
MKDVFIVGAARTAIGRFNGTLAGFRAPELGAFALGAAIERAGLKPDLIEECIMGCVLPAGLGQNPARQAARLAKIPDHTGSFTVNKVCGSGLKAVMLAAQAIQCGDHDLIAAGGMENMSAAPYLSREARSGARMGDVKLVDSMVYDGIWDVYNDFHMGNTGELVAEKYGITREMQDRFALQSQQKATAATHAGKFQWEITPVTVPQRKKDPIVFQTDEGPRADTTLEALAKLKPAFKKDGTVTAGNSSTINDAGAAVVVASGAKVKELALKPIARITGYATGGMAPEWVMMAPVEATRNLFRKMGVGLDHFQLYEYNEAFAAQGCALTKVLELDPAKLNVHGGAVALGHPIGCSGARVLVTLLGALRDRKLRTGYAALCLGGGNAVALAVEIM